MTGGCEGGWSDGGTRDGSGTHVTQQMPIIIIIHMLPSQIHTAIAIATTSAVTGLRTEDVNTARASEDDNRSDDGAIGMAHGRMAESQRPMRQSRRRCQTAVTAAQPDQAGHPATAAGEGGAAGVQQRGMDHEPHTVSHSRGLVIAWRELLLLQCGYTVHRLRGRSTQCDTPRIMFSSMR